MHGRLEPADELPAGDLGRILGSDLEPLEPGEGTRTETSWQSPRGQPRSLQGRVVRGCEGGKRCMTDTQFVHRTHVLAGLR